MSVPSFRGGDISRKENYRRLDSCTADMHDFRAPPPVPGVPNWATCRSCGGMARRDTAVMYAVGVRTGMAMAAELARRVSEDIHDVQQTALLDSDASCEGAE